MESNLDRFAEAAREYITWCESPACEAEAEARDAVRHLTRLCALGIELRRVSEVDFEFEGREADSKTWQAVYDRCAALPFSDYSKVFEPLDVPPEEPVLANLADDLADIFRDLVRGLALYHSGNAAEAEWEWRESFDSHWGRHASSALGALVHWFAETRS